MKTIDVIVTELRRQRKSNRGTGLGRFDDADPTSAVIDGRVDLVAMAEAIDRQLRDWRLIETAPRDGSKFLALTADFEHGIRFNERIQEARWTGKTPDDRIGHFGSANGQMVTHWMPLQPTPKAGER